MHPLVTVATRVVSSKAVSKLLTTVVVEIGDRLFKKVIKKLDTKKGVPVNVESVEAEEQQGEIQL